MMNKILESIKNQPITVSQWVVGFVGILSVRFILEAFSSPTTSGIIPSDPFTLVHYLLFFLSVILGIACIVGFFTKKYAETVKLLLFALPITWIAPILDIIISSGTGYRMSYVFNSHKELLLDFFRFFSPQIMQWATYGMRVEILIILCGIGWYVWTQRKKILPVVLSVIATYFLIFLIGSTPGILYTVTNPNAEVTETSYGTFYYVAELVTESNIFHNTLHETAFSVPPIRFFELGFNKLMSQILFVLSILFSAILFWNIDKQKFKAVLKNSRGERILFYLTLLVLGMCGAYLLGNKLGSWVDILSIVCLMFAWIGIWLYAVQVNDIEDIDIDKISNQERPLVQHTITASEAKEIGYIWLIVALAGSWSVGFYPFYMCLVAIIISYVYSVPPLRLKRVTALSTFLISIACLVTILAGFFFVSINKVVATFPVLFVIKILIIFTLGVSIKDMKDVEGDGVNGIKTVPVIFGKNGPWVVGVFFGLSVLLVPIFISFYLLYIIAIPTAIIGYKLVTKTPYKEKSVFILYFSYLILSVILFAITPWVVSLF
ncbi:MAG: hypothetical protein A2566_03190 [Candidatus Zambryskibacteria bacterium RIFOXYD1_FULL_40_13]|nr:MAG: bacteriochlorophyll/chlorophyll a synthase, chlorophyll synthase [Parcubacteria group bacterium GW2011_GWC1_39_12]KKR19451.1 MAG: 4-hydroxybenzoate polyprenyltransferase-like protein prenyltransferase [Parcubacteria group bacterium GW2011_GWF1_39_37]KKR35077.1 MAG: 4-hydroxybenzoate polyprenyltransferase-like protein prenyltransferase [Parcubacteria group bacterium GW2011_GWC2_40_10]KKR52400.1 MAG: 4-hydroxybenzoate polyprenyltransferase-like protein prenyltransferase [Parcubacteria grou